MAIAESQTHLKNCERFDAAFGTDAEQQPVLERFEGLLDQRDSFSRACFPSHFTASALVFDPEREKVLLTHHRKLSKWLQLGGHFDEAQDPYLTAYREVLEESGLSTVRAIVEEGVPFCYDLDIHTIPARKNEPEHEHFDFRFLFSADSTQEIQISSESLELAWFPIPEALRLSAERSMQRQFEKLQFLQRNKPSLFHI